MPDRFFLIDSGDTAYQVAIIRDTGDLPAKCIR